MSAESLSTWATLLYNNSPKSIKLFYTNDIFFPVTFILHNVFQNKRLLETK